MLQLPFVATRIYTPPLFEVRVIDQSDTYVYFSETKHFASCVMWNVFFTMFIGKGRHSLQLGYEALLSCNLSHSPHFNVAAPHNWVYSDGSYG